MKKKLKKLIEPKIDGLGPDDLKKIHRAVRQVWSWSQPHRLAKKRTLGKDGFHRCELCKRKVPKVFVDHKIAVGKIGGTDYIPRMWCSSAELQVICKKCHDAKTANERLGF